jgi:hypothetical protein
MPNNSDCPFCNLDKSRVIIANDDAIAFNDGFPVTPGHSLIVPKRHISSFFEATREEQAALFDLLAEMRQLLLNPPLSGKGSGNGVRPDIRTFVAEKIKAGSAPDMRQYHLGHKSGHKSGQACKLAKLQGTRLWGHSQSLTFDGARGRHTL